MEMDGRSRGTVIVPRTNATGFATGSDTSGITRRRRGSRVSSRWAPGGFDIIPPRVAAPALG